MSKKGRLMDTFKDICIIVALAVIFGGFCSLALHVLINFHLILSSGWALAIVILSIFPYFALEHRIKKLWKKIMK